MTDTEKKKVDLASLKIDPAARGRRGGRRVWMALGVAALGLGAALLVAEAARGRRVRVDVAAAREAGGERGLSVLTASGYVTPRERATVAAKITGRVAEMRVAEGMRVAKDQVLALLDDAEARVALDTARAQRNVAEAAIAEPGVQLVDAERDLERALDLRKRDLISQQEEDHARAVVDGLKARIGLMRMQLRAAEALVAQAEQDLRNCTVRAPFDGVAVSRDAQVGEMVSPVSAGGGFTRTGIATIVNMDSLEVEVDVNESYLARVREGQAADALLDAYPDWRIPAHVRTIIPTADRQKATVKVRLAFEKPDPRILPDMGVKVSFLQPAGAGGEKACCLVPLPAVMDSEGQPVVWTVTGGRIERRPVRVGRAVEKDVEILSGVSPGDTVVVAADAPLEPGLKAEVKK
jgi:RND family efflux transporter MFP subunit